MTDDGLGKGSFEMKEYKVEWLPHLENSIPIVARQNRISMYTIALEGWRRGLRLKFYETVDEEKRRVLIYSLDDGKKTHYFRESSGDANSKESHIICKDKGRTATYLQQAGVPIPNGYRFDASHSIQKIIDASQSLKYPLVVKPVGESSGRGVITNIQTDDQLHEALEQLRIKLSFEEVLVQEHIMGDEVRIYVLDEEVIAAVKRIPANIIGDGVSTINQLIEKKNKMRKQVPHLHYRPIVIDASIQKLIQSQGYTLDSVLEKDKRLFLRTISNISAGGDPIDVTDQLSATQKEIAIKATRAIPGLTHCGIDMIVSDDGAEVILEINTYPGIGSHLFPIEGKARDIPQALIDYYFPHTERQSKEYFNLQEILEHLAKGVLSEIELKPVNTKPLVTRQIHATTDLTVHSFYKKINNEITKRELHGFIQKQGKSVMIILGHPDETMILQFYHFLINRKHFLKIHQIAIDNYEKPIQQGFECIDDLSQRSPMELELEHRQNLQKIRRVEREVNRLSKRIHLITNSQSWKITAPIRKMSQAISKIRSFFPI